LARSNLINSIALKLIFREAACFPILIAKSLALKFAFLKCEILTMKITFKISLQTLQAVVCKKVLFDSFHLFKVKETLFRCFYGQVHLFVNEWFRPIADCQIQIICFTKELIVFRQLNHHFLTKASVTLTSFYLFLHSINANTILFAVQFLF